MSVSLPGSLLQPLEPFGSFFLSLSLIPFLQPFFPFLLAFFFFLSTKPFSRSFTRSSPPRKKGLSFPFLSAVSIQSFFFPY